MEAYVAISGPLDILKFEGAIFIFIFYKKNYFFKFCYFFNFLFSWFRITIV